MKIGDIAAMSMPVLVRNANLEKVLSVMAKILPERYPASCACPRCMNDIIALALNYLPPHYYVDADDSKTFGSPGVMVENAVAEAIERVIENPRHGNREQK